MDSRQCLASLALVLFATVTVGAAQQRLTTDIATDPAEARFVYHDVENFIRASHLISSGADPAEVIQSHYIDRASPGLVVFIEKYDLTMERLLAAMEEHPEAYQRIESNLTALRSREPYFREVYSNLQAVVPDAVFPPTYFVVAGHRGIGSGSVEGPLISIEKKTAASIEADLSSTLVHEMVHMQQLAAVGEAYFAIFSGEQRTLLALSIREGASTFIARLVSGGSEHKNQAHDYLLAHEDELWQTFRGEALGNETGDWLWRKPADPDQPQDVGYALGARIVESYYRAASDKGKAAREIMAITDYPAFLEASGYRPDSSP